MMIVEVEKKALAFIGNALQKNTCKALY